MKKIFFIAVILVTVFSFLYVNRVNGKNNEIRGVFISYLEYIEHFKDKNYLEIEEEVKKIVSSLEDYNINTIYLQVRMFSDSIYLSKIYPYTDIIASDIDILDLFLKYSHKNNIKIYAWINPYRISSDTDINKISKNNPAYIYLDTNNVKIIEGKGIYYNPASGVVKNLILAGIFEIIDNYDIDGVLFDDYFYPCDDIDLDNYNKLDSNITLTEFRLDQVNDLIRRVYKLIKSVNNNIEFGVSPDGNISNNYNTHYADVKTWLSNDGYVDFIMPQLYYGFNHETKPFTNTLEEWDSLIKNDVKLIASLALYKAGKVDDYAKSGKNEWIENSDIIVRQIVESRKKINYKGFSLYRYQYLISNENANLYSEVNGYQKFIKKN